MSNEYRHTSGQTIGVEEGTEFDSVLSTEPDWTLIGSGEVVEVPEVEPEDESSSDPEDADDPQVEDEDEESKPETIDPEDYSRPELNAIAAERRIEDPESLKSKAEVAEAINALTKEDEDE